MALAHFVDHYIADVNGNGELEPVSGALVDVFQQGTEIVITETIYATDNLAGATLSSPLNTATDGKIEFYLASPKRVDLRLTKAGLEDLTRTVDADRNGINLRGAWSSATEYQANDAVTFSGETWGALRTNTNVSPVEGADWTKLAAAGTAQAAFRGARMYVATSYAATGSLQITAYDTADFDSDAFISGLGGTGAKFTIPAGLGGKYLIQGLTTWAANAGGTIRQVGIQKNTVNMATNRQFGGFTAGQAASVAFQIMLALVPGDVIVSTNAEDFVGDINITGGIGITYFEIARLGT